MLWKVHPRHICKSKTDWSKEITSFHIIMIWMGLIMSLWGLKVVFSLYCWILQASSEVSDTNSLLAATLTTIHMIHIQTQDIKRTDFTIKCITNSICNNMWIRILKMKKLQWCPTTFITRSTNQWNTWTIWCPKITVLPIWNKRSKSIIIRQNLVCQIRMILSFKMGSIHRIGIISPANWKQKIAPAQSLNHLLSSPISAAALIIIRIVMALRPNHNLAKAVNYIQIRFSVTNP